jgi:hypothetical protein
MDGITGSGELTGQENATGRSSPFKITTPKISPAVLYNQFIPQTPKVKALIKSGMISALPSFSDKASKDCRSSPSQNGRATATPSRDSYVPAMIPEFIPKTPKAKAMLPANRGTEYGTFKTNSSYIGSILSSGMAPLPSRGRRRVADEPSATRLYTAQPVARWEPLVPVSDDFCHTETKGLDLTLEQVETYKKETFTGLALSDVLGGKRDLEREAYLIRSVQPVGTWIPLPEEPKPVTAQEYSKIREVYENNQTVILNQVDRNMLTRYEAAKVLQNLEEWMVCFTVSGEKLVNGGMSIYCDEDAREYIGEFDPQIVQYLDSVYKRWGKTSTKGKHPFFGTEKVKKPRGKKKQQY